MLVGYARVSKIDQQDTAAQIAALKEAGVERIFKENASGGRWDRPQLHRSLDQLRKQDTFAEFERAMIRERTKVGLKQARQQGRVGGRPSKLTTAQQQELLNMISSGRKSSSEAARLFDVHPSTVSRLISKHRQQS